MTLHVGTGTFLPVRSENIAEHRMHAEHFCISASAAGRINEAGRIVAVGTTVVRVLESAKRENGKLIGQEVPQTFSFIRHIGFKLSMFF